ncbi:MAG: hypothetical protein HYV07_13790 [Deltaproteobacteria bacterium]|nr:hypothetical protein [Deltaproteobacteria bacterium]
MRLRIVALVLAGCASETTDPNDEPRVRDVPGYRLERMYAARGQSGRVHVGGFEGAAPAGSIVEIVTLNGTSSAATDTRGRFRTSLDTNEASVTLRIGDLEESFRVRDQGAFTRARRAPISGLGSVPNDVLVDPDGSIAVARSQDNAVGLIEPNGELGVGVRLPDSDGTPPRKANPWFLAELGEKRVAVTAYGQSKVYVVDLSSSRVESSYSLEHEIPLASPFELTRPFDVDDDGQAESTITAFRPRGAQGLAVTDDFVLATFTSVFAAGVGADLPVVLPGVLARWSRASPSRAPETIVLDALNPQEVRVSPRGTAWVVCSGALARVGDPTRALTPGAVFEVGFDGELRVVRKLDLDDFAPSSAVELEGQLLVSSLVLGRVRSIPLDAPENAATININELPVDSIFRLTPILGSLALVPSFNSDRLHVIDLVSGELDPPPFFEPLIIGEGGSFLSGLQVVATRPGRAGVDFTGPDLFALLGLASEVVPIELRKVLGP